MGLRLLAPTAILLGAVQAGSNAWGTGTGVVVGVEHSSTVWTTIVVPTFTTYCPSPTTWAYRNVTYTITSETTITLPCPCTLSISTPHPITTTSTFTTEVPCSPETTLSHSTSFPSVDSTFLSPPVNLPTAFSSSTVVSTTVIVGTPPPSTFLSGTTAIGSSSPTPTIPTKTPLTPTISPVGVAIAGAHKIGLTGGALGYLAGLAALAL